MNHDPRTYLLPTYQEFANFDRQWSSNNLEIAVRKLGVAIHVPFVRSGHGESRYSVKRMFPERISVATGLIVEPNLYHVTLRYGFYNLLLKAYASFPVPDALYWYTNNLREYDSNGSVWGSLANQIDYCDGLEEHLREFLTERFAGLRGSELLVMNIRVGEVMLVYQQERAGVIERLAAFGAKPGNYTVEHGGALLRTPGYEGLDYVLDFNGHHPDRHHEDLDFVRNYWFKRKLALLVDSTA